MSGTAKRRAPHPAYLRPAAVVVRAWDDGAGDHVRILDALQVAAAYGEDGRAYLTGWVATLLAARDRVLP